MLGRVLLIAPYKGLATLAGRMARRRRDLDITVRTADLEQAVPLLEWAHGKGFDLVISRGGTALLLEKLGSLPVVEIAVSGYDLFRLTSFIKDYSSRVTLIGFPNVCAGVATFSRYLNVDIPYTVVHHTEEVDAAILRARDDGCVVIGDTVTVRKAEEIGVKGILISSGPESISLAFELAANLLRGMRRMRDRQKAVEHSLNSLGRGVVLCAAEGGQGTLMPSAHVSPQRQHWRDNLVSFFAAHHSMPEGPFLLKKGPISSDVPPEAVLAPVVDGRRVLLFHAADVLGDRPVRQVLIDTPPVTLRQLIADQHHLEHPARRARMLLESVGVFALVGEPGTGRTRMLRAIQITLYGGVPRLLAGVDIRHGVREALRLVLDTLASATGSLVHLSGVERLRRADQEQLARELNTYGHGVALLFSDSPDRLAKQGALSPAVAALVRDRDIRLPGVADDPVVLEASVLYSLMDANARHGKNVRGVAPAVLEAIRARPWPRNFEDLSRFIDRLVRDAPDGDHKISDLPAVSEASVSNRNTEGFSVDLSRPLEEIEARIIEAVLAEERGNQSAAAARLGIGRTTLWRKLQHRR